jgi:hypothetical protein
MGGYGRHEMIGSLSSARRETVNINWDDRPRHEDIPTNLTWWELQSEDVSPDPPLDGPEAIEWLSSETKKCTLKQ